MANQPQKSRGVKHQTVEIPTTHEALQLCLFPPRLFIRAGPDLISAIWWQRQTNSSGNGLAHTSKHQVLSDLPQKKMGKGEWRYCFPSQPEGITSTSKIVRYRLAFLVFPEIHLKSYSIIH